jgi:hypothetical protein
MKLIHNTGADRVIDLMRPHLKHGNQLGCVTPSFSLFAFAELRDALQVVLGSFAFSTDGLGLTPGNPLSLIQASESADEAAQLARWFDHQWAALGRRQQ